MSSSEKDPYLYLSLDMLNRAMKESEKKDKTKWSRAAKLLKQAEAMENALKTIRATCIINRKRHSKKKEVLFHEAIDVIQQMTKQGLEKPK